MTAQESGVSATTGSKIPWCFIGDPLEHDAQVFRMIKPRLFGYFRKGQIRVYEEFLGLADAHMTYLILRGSAHEFAEPAVQQAATDIHPFRQFFDPKVIACFRPDYLQGLHDARILDGQRLG